MGAEKNRKYLEKSASLIMNLKPFNASVIQPNTT